MSLINFFALRKNKLTVLFTLSYVFAFTVNSFFQQNFEFLYYTLLMTALIYITIYIDRQLHLGFFIVFNLSLLGFLHLLGGNFYFADGIRLYDTYFIGHLIKYDNIIHTYATFIATFALYGLLTPFLDERLRKRWGVLSLVLVLMALGLGTINEVVEFFAVVFLGAAEQVGGYFNNSLDLVFNTLGSIAACVILYLTNLRRERLNEKKSLSIDNATPSS